MPTACSSGISLLRYSPRDHLPGISPPLEIAFRRASHPAYLATSAQIPATRRLTHARFGPIVFSERLHGRAPNPVESSQWSPDDDPNWGGFHAQPYTHATAFFGSTGAVDMRNHRVGTVSFGSGSLPPLTPASLPPHASGLGGVSCPARPEPSGPSGRRTSGSFPRRSGSISRARRRCCGARAPAATAA
jgi:hypothetical protein